MRATSSSALWLTDKSQKRLTHGTKRIVKHLGRRPNASGAPRVPQEGGHCQWHWCWHQKATIRAKMPTWAWKLSLRHTTRLGSFFCLVRSLSVRDGGLGQIFADPKPQRKSQAFKKFLRSARGSRVPWLHLLETGASYKAKLSTRGEEIFPSFCSQFSEAWKLIKNNRNTMW